MPHPSSFTLALAAVLLSSPAAAIEEPSYTVERRGEGFEIRRYEPYVVAEYRSDADFERAGSEAFRPLFKFIDGRNDGGETIDMTAPVEQQSGRKIAMTAPVNQSASSDGQFVVSFVMPSGMTLETAPRPLDPKISLRQVPERRLAVREYRGGWSESRYRSEETALVRALEAEGETQLGPPIFARYNSPFMIWFLRRNAVMVEVARSPAAN